MINSNTTLPKEKAGSLYMDDSGTFVIANATTDCLWKCEIQALFLQALVLLFLLVQ